MPTTCWPLLPLELLRWESPAACSPIATNRIPRIGTGVFPRRPVRGKPCAYPSPFPVWAGGAPGPTVGLCRSGGAGLAQLPPGGRRVFFLGPQPRPQWTSARRPGAMFRSPGFQGGGGLTHKPALRRPYRRPTSCNYDLAAGPMAGPGPCPSVRAKSTRGLLITRTTSFSFHRGISPGGPSTFLTYFFACDGYAFAYGTCPFAPERLVRRVGRSFTKRHPRRGQRVAGLSKASLPAACPNPRTVLPFFRSLAHGAAHAASS